MAMTWVQYYATSWSPLHSAKYISAKISFLKQLPPKPTELFKNLSPILVSVERHFFTYVISEPYYSHKIAILLIEETLWAKKQLAANLESSADALLVKIILSYPAYLYKSDNLLIS